MSLDTMLVTLRKAQAILEAASPLHLDERDIDQMTHLIDAAREYVEASLEDLEAVLDQGQDARS